MKKLGFLVFIIICFLLFAGETLAEITFEPNVRVDDTGASISGQECPSVAVAPDGEVYVVWQDYRNGNLNIYSARSTDGGASFGRNVRVDDASLSTSLQDPPSIAIAPNGDIYVVWQDYRNGNLNIYFARSTDGNASFGRNIRVDDTGTSTIQYYPSIAVAPNGDIYVVWTERNGSRDIYFAKSTDGGASFERKVRVDDTGASDSYQGEPSVAVASNGDICVTWHDRRNGNDDDIYFAKSTDGGTSFEPNVRVDDTGASTSEQSSPEIAVAPNGDIYVAWIDERNGIQHDIYFARSTDSGVSFRTNVRVNDTGVLIVDPGIAVAPNGDIYVAWDDNRNGNWDIYFARSTDSGVSFRTNVRVNDTGMSDSNQFQPSIAVDTNANIYIAWQDERNGNFDIYFARRELPGDVNGDCKVNILDLVYVRNHLGQDPNSSPEAKRCDVNEDGKINILDLVFVRNHLGTSCE